jgi:MipA family protein
MFASRSFALAALAALALLSQSGASAQSLRHAFGNDSAADFNASLGLAIAAAPEYVGARHVRASAVPEFNLAYRTRDFGRFAFGTAAGGLVWLPVDTSPVTAGVLLSYDSGRRDGDDGDAYRPGGARLRGMGAIRGSLLYGGFASVDLGPASLTAYALKAPSGKGSGGAQGALSLEVPLPTTGGVEMSLSGNLNIADRRYMQAYFGVDALQSQNSGLARHDAGGGLKSAGLSLEAFYPLSRTWNLQGNVGAEWLMRGAASSPVTERRMQPRAALGMSYRF